MNPIVNTVVIVLTDIKRWTWQAVLGLLLVLAAFIVPRLVAVAAGVTDILEVGNLVGLALVAAEVARARAQSPPPSSTLDQRGSSTIGLLTALVLLAILPLLLSMTGCGLLGPVQVEAERSIKWERRPGPTCYVRTLADGEIATETTAPFACVPPPEFCAPGPGEPGYEVTP